MLNDEIRMQPAVILLDASFPTFGFLFMGAPLAPDPIAIDRLNFLHILFTFAWVAGTLSVSCRHAVSSAVVGATSSPPSKHVTESSVPGLSGSCTGTYGGSDVFGSSSWGESTAGIL